MFLCQCPLVEKAFLLFLLFLNGSFSFFYLLFGSLVSCELSLVDASSVSSTFFVVDSLVRVF